MKFRRQTRLPARLAQDWVRFVIRRISRHLQPFRDRVGLGPFPGPLPKEPAKGAARFARTNPSDPASGFAGEATRDSQRCRPPRPRLRLPVGRWPTGKKLKFASVGRKSPASMRGSILTVELGSFRNTAVGSLKFGQNRPACYSSTSPPPE